MDYGQLTKEEHDAMIKMVRDLPHGVGRKSYKMTRRMYEELSNVSGDAADKS